MIIKKTAWHYRLNKVLAPFWSNDDYNLCRYFWLTFGHLLLLLIPLLAIVLFLFLLISPFFQNFYWGMCQLILTIFIFGCFIFPVAAIYCFRKIAPPEKTTIKTPNIIIEYYKALKEKYCPKIEFID